MAPSQGKKQITTYGAQYCCAMNCSNNGKTSFDARTGQTVRFFSFPNAEKEKERCQQWIVNIQRKDITISNLGKRKRVCSVHFEENAFNCPSEIHSSRLLPTAVPTLVNCPNPLSSISCRRKQPKKRDPNDKLTPKRTRSSCHLTSDPSTSATVSQDTAPPDTEPESVLKRQLDETRRALEAFKKENRNLKRQLKTTKTSIEKLKEQHARTVAKLQAEIDVHCWSFGLKNESAKLKLCPLCEKYHNWSTVIN